MDRKNKTYRLLFLFPIIIGIIFVSLFFSYLFQDDYAYLNYVHIGVKNETKLTFIIKLNDSKKIWEYVIKPNSHDFIKIRSKILLENYSELDCYITIIEKHSNNVISEKLCRWGVDNEFWSFSAHGGLWFPITILENENEIIVKYGRTGNWGG